jgi:hypothetical protein
VAGRLFVRRRDGLIEPRLSERGWIFIEHAITHVGAAEHDVDHPWHAAMHGRIAPDEEHDDPLRLFERQSAYASQADMAREALRLERWSDAQAWSVFATLQVSLRLFSASCEVTSPSELTAEQRDTIESFQVILDRLAEVLAT